MATGGASDNDELMNLAAAMAAKTPREALGRCLSSSLELAAVAHALGLDVPLSLLRWRLRDDPQFLEHWALGLSDGAVLDLTAVQIDRNPYPLRLVSDYPCSYGKPKSYPLSLVMTVLDSGTSEVDGRYTWSTLFRLHFRLFRHDFARGLKQRSLPVMVSASQALLSETLTLTLHMTLHAAQQRLDYLLSAQK